MEELSSKGDIGGDEEIEWNYNTNGRSKKLVGSVDGPRPTCMRTMELRMARKMTKEVEVEENRNNCKGSRMA